MLPFGALSGLLVMAVVNYVTPEQYESEAIIEVKPQIDFETFPSQVVPMFLATEFNKIKSRASLAEVVKKLELSNQWGMNQDAVIRILKEIVITENIRGTDLIAIRVRHTDRELTRDIAAEVAKIYRDYRAEMVKRDSNRRLSELNKAVKDQDEKVEERRKIYAKLLYNMGSHPSILMHDESSDTPAEAITRAQYQQDIIDAKRDLETDHALLQSIKLKKVSATIASKISDESVVVHEEPQIPQTPVFPNITLNLTFGAVGGFLLSPLLALLVILLLNRLNLVEKARA